MNNLFVLQRDLGTALVEAKQTIQGQEQWIISQKSTELDLRQEVSDLRHEVGVLQDRLSYDAGREIGGGDAESSPSSTSGSRTVKVSLTQAEQQVQVRETTLWGAVTRASDSTKRSQLQIQGYSIEPRSNSRDHSFKYRATLLNLGQIREIPASNTGLLY